MTNPYSVKAVLVSDSYICYSSAGGFGLQSTWVKNWLPWCLSLGKKTRKEEASGEPDSLAVVLREEFAEDSN
jgi:hypothetical protein